jgi:hypothetical protein
MKITAKTVAASAPVQNAPTQGAPAENKPAMASDSLQVARPAQTRSNPGTEALALLNEAAALPPMPRKKDEQAAWLMDGFARQMKMSAAEEAMRKAWGKGQIDGNTLSVARSKSWAVDRELAKAPGYEAAKKEFFGAVINQANALIDASANFPAPPADAAGKKAWIAQAKGEVAKLQEANRIMKDCWIHHQVLPFDAMTAASRKVSAFEFNIRKAELELNPPAPRQPGTPGTGGPGRPLFELTQGAQRGLDSNNPVGQTVGAIVMPIALTLDLIDLLTRPLQMVEAAKKVEVKKATVVVNGGQVSIKK